MTRSWKVAAACVVVLLALDASALVLFSRSSRTPPFGGGGRFVRAEPAPSTTTSAETRPAPTTTVPPTTSSIVPATTTTALPATTTTEPIGPTTTAEPIGPSQRGAADRPRPPAIGTYTFAVSGTEGASIAGSRSFPPEMTLVAHRRDGIGQDQVVLDQEFSGQHEEREIARYQDDGIFLTDEAGSLSFGLITQTSDVTYDPPMGQIPFPLAVGTSRSGTSTARERSGSVARVDDWSTRIVGQETLTIAGEQAQTWLVVFERGSRPGTNEQVTQTTRYWFDPVRGMSVRWEETVHGERNSRLIRGRYDEHYTATLQAFRPA